MAVAMVVAMAEVMAGATVRVMVVAMAEPTAVETERTMVVETAEPMVEAVEAVEMVEVEAGAGVDVDVVGVGLVEATRQLLIQQVPKIGYWYLCFAIHRTTVCHHQSLPRARSHQATIGMKRRKISLFADACCSVLHERSPHLCSQTGGHPLIRESGDDGVSQHVCRHQQRLFPYRYSSYDC